MWKRFIAYVAPIVVLALLIACDGVPWVHSSSDSEAGRDASSSFPSSDDDAADRVDPSTLSASESCCLIADPLAANPRAGCGDPAIEACVCTHRPSCCEDIWGFECVIDTVAACGICNVMDPLVVAAMDVDTDNDGRSDFDELVEGKDPEDPTDGPDIDGDGIPNEDDPDVDGDGILNGFDLDVDGDGVLNVFDPDIDGDGVVNFIDVDDDGDGLLDDDDLDDDADGMADDKCIRDEDCDDGNVCNGQEVCTLIAICRLGPPPDCSDHVACTIDGCQPYSGCFHTPDDTACNDGVDCTADTCDDMLGCLHEADDNACNDNIDCTADSCDDALGCIHNADDAACDDNVDCTEDLCNSTLGCVHDPNDEECKNECAKRYWCDTSKGCQAEKKDTEMCATASDCPDEEGFKKECSNCACVYRRP